MRIGVIYHLDNQLSNLEPDARKKQREITIRPLVGAFFAWVKEVGDSNRLPKGNHWKGSTTVSIRRRHWKCSWIMAKFRLIITQRKGRYVASACTNIHGNWSTVLIERNPARSITETAKVNHLNPFRYLEHALTVLKDHRDDKDYLFIEELLPWSDQLPEICRSKSKTTNL